MIARASNANRQTEFYNNKQQESQQFQIFLKMGDPEDSGGGLANDQLQEQPNVNKDVTLNHPVLCVIIGWFEKYAKEGMSTVELTQFLSSMK